MNIIIATIKSWNIENAERFREKIKGRDNVYIFTDKRELTIQNVDALNPNYIFFPHWSYLIPSEIYTKYECVVFHMTDLPYGRGGSPLQNLIVRGHTETKISAIRVEKELDAGQIYMKEQLSLEGSADTILRRASEVIFECMIPRFISERPMPVPQQGVPTLFVRRKPEDGELLETMDGKTLYDYIRMLDAEGYPNAFINYGDWQLSFSNADIDGTDITAKVRFRRKSNE